MLSLFDRVQDSTVKLQLKHYNRNKIDTIAWHYSSLGAELFSLSLGMLPPLPLQVQYFRRQTMTLESWARLSVSHEAGKFNCS